MARKNNKSKAKTKSNNNNLITYLLVSYALTQESGTTEKAKKIASSWMNELKLQLLLQSFELRKNKIRIT